MTQAFGTLSGGSALRAVFLAKRCYSAPRAPVKSPTGTFALGPVSLRQLLNLKFKFKVPSPPFVGDLVSIGLEATLRVGRASASESGGPGAAAASATAGDYCQWRSSFSSLLGR